jgi:hypothetical protein
MNHKKKYKADTFTTTTTVLNVHSQTSATTINGTNSRGCHYFLICHVVTVIVNVLLPLSLSVAWSNNRNTTLLIGNHGDAVMTDTATLRTYFFRHSTDDPDVL